MKRLTSLISALMLAQTLGAFDFGADLRSFSAAYGGEDTVVVLRESTLVWFQDTSQNRVLRFSGYYDFSAQFTLPETYTLQPYRFDLGTSLAAFYFPLRLGAEGMAALSLGRLEVSTPSGQVLDGNLDSLDFSWQTGSWKFGLTGGYTGLLNKKSANIILTQQDYDNSSRQEVTFAPKKLLIGFQASNTEGVERHDFHLGLYSQFDLETPALNTQWVEFTAEGRPFRSFKWKVWAVGLIWDEAKPQLSLASGWRFQVSLPELSGLILVQSLDWASGTGDVLRQYTPFNQIPVGDIFSAAFSDLVLPKVYGIVSPLRGLSAGFSTMGVFRTTQNKPSDPYFPMDGTSSYLGSEGQLFADLSPFSDFQLQIKSGAFLPYSGEGGYPAGTPVRWSASLNAKLFI